MNSPKLAIFRWGTPKLTNLAPAINLLQNLTWCAQPHDSHNDVGEKARLMNSSSFLLVDTTVHVQLSIIIPSNLFIHSRSLYPLCRRKLYLLLLCC